MKNKSLVAVVVIGVLSLLLLNNTLGSASTLLLLKWDGGTDETGVSLNSPVGDSSVGGALLSHILFAVVVIGLLQWSGLWEQMKDLYSILVEWINAAKTAAKTSMADPGNVELIRRINNQDSQLQAQITEQSSDVESIKWSLRRMTAEPQWAKARLVNDPVDVGNSTGGTTNG